MAGGVDTWFGHPGTLQGVNFIVTSNLLDKRCDLGATLMIEWNQLTRCLADKRILKYPLLTIEEFGRRRSLNRLTRIIFLPGQGGREVSSLGT